MVEELTSFERAKISNLIPELAQRTGISYKKLAAILCPPKKDYGPGTVVRIPMKEGWAYELRQDPTGLLLKDVRYERDSIIKATFT